MESRRVFLTGLLVASASGLAGQGVPAPQTPVVRNPPSQNPSGQAPDSEAPPSPDLDKKILESNEKDMKKKVEQLYELAKELKEEVEKTDSTKVLNLLVFKKTEEIEKLAHDIRNRSKG